MPKPASEKPRKAAPPAFKWSPFDFIYKDKAAGRRPTQKDFDKFENYLVVSCLSSDKNLRGLARVFNLKSFSKLPKEHQCKAYNSINGYPVQGTFPGVKKNRKHANEEIVAKIMWAFDCNLARAERYRDDPRVNLDEVEAEYDAFHGIM